MTFRFERDTMTINTTTRDDTKRDEYGNLPGEYKERTSWARLTRDFWLGDIGKDEMIKPPSFDPFKDPYGPTPMSMWTPIDWQLLSAQCVSRGKASKKYQQKRINGKKPIKIIKQNGKIGYYESAAKAAKYLEMSVDMVYYHCKVRTPDKRGRYILYLGDGEVMPKKENKNLPKPIIVETCNDITIYKSARDAAISLGMHHCSISRRARSESKIEGITMRYLTTVEMDEYKRKRSIDE